MFTKILIANRGAIAVRIERTLKKMGIKSVAVYTKADENSLHVENADEAVLIGDGPAKDSYLNFEKIIKAAIDAGAQAVHPGYGFLSENTDFAKACEENGIVFIGPKSEHIELFGLKHTARDLARKAGVPLLEGTSLIKNCEEAVAAADSIGYPVILKSTAGGGGIGMRICCSADELRDCFDAVCHLAGANFGNSGTFLEKYIERARHVEVQIFGNQYGEVVTLGERDCSVQRRNQKVMEETPAPNIRPEVKEEMFKAAKSLAGSAGYRNAGTVEFLYDEKNETFYFLEVNTRLQVEHGITEQTTGIDLVEWMILEAAGELKDMQKKLSSPKGCSIEARIYAEDSINSFMPSSGKIDKIIMPDDVRVETWVTDGINVSSFYDPMLAKLIVTADTREKAIEKMAYVLKNARYYGITTNLQYLSSFVDRDDYKKGLLCTSMLNGFMPEEASIEVIDGGIQSTIQDFPGRTGYWGVGVPPCGAMDDYSFRIGNAILGNSLDCAGIELTMRGGTYKFRTAVTFCITGADMSAKLDDEPIPMYECITAKAGQILSFGQAEKGMRTYITIAGGIDVPEILGSRSTFTLGNFGGHQGRALRAGDVIRLNEKHTTDRHYSLPEKYRPEMTNEWLIGVIPGPHCTKEFLHPDYLENLVNSEFEVNFNSARTGVRLNGSIPHWVREDGGEAGLHPSNIHDNAYAIGAMDLTGDQSILLGPDGPSLGGFVCSVCTASAQLWKLGQLHPGDKVKFSLLTLEEAEALKKLERENINIILNGGTELNEIDVENGGRLLDSEYPILVKETKGERFEITIRASGDEYILIEYGEMELNIELRFQVHVLMQELEKKNLPIIDITPGIRSLQIHFDSDRINIKELCRIVLETDKNLPDLDSITVPSRIVKLPLSWDDPQTQLAAERYMKTVRPNAPWCPSNPEFIRRINGLDSIEEVKKIVFDAKYLVLGLGDVYLGAPVATPVDPRHRLVTTKYNPARPWTPENAVGIGGAYLCVYGMEGPGGYQFVGRTVQMWNLLRSTNSFKEGKPWLLNFFDQLQFYPVSHEELMKMREDFPRGKFNVEIEDTSFNLGEYKKFLEGIKESAHIFKEHQEKSFEEERQRWKDQGLDEFVSEHEESQLPVENEIPEGCRAVVSNMPGSVWKIGTHKGEIVKKGDKLVIIESMKMEFSIDAPCDGVVEDIFVNQSEQINAGQSVACIKC